jgi:hypothetical protein
VRVEQRDLGVDLGDGDLLTEHSRTAASSTVQERLARSPSTGERFSHRSPHQPASARTTAPDSAGVILARGREPQQFADELHTLLTNVGIQGPYVLVANSASGKTARQPQPRLTCAAKGSRWRFAP